jgi:biopolymer transport protein ExbB/TolQ
VLFAILSIVAAIIIYLQSQDFRKQKKELLTKHENYFNFHNRKLINLGTRYQNLIKQLENNQNSNNNEAQKLLSELRKEKDLIRSELYNNN